MEQDIQSDWDNRNQLDNISLNEKIVSAHDRNKTLYYFHTLSFEMTMSNLETDVGILIHTFSMYL